MINTIVCGDCLEVLRNMGDESINCCVTSPPYWGLRDYGVDGQLGLEKTPEEYVEKMVAVFREVRRVLKKDGTLWLNLGDSYSGSGAGGGGNRKGNEHGQHDIMATRGGPMVTGGLKPKDLVGIPWMTAFALRADGWYLRQDIIWSKPNPMPESVKDRCTKSHEYIFLLSKSAKYYYDGDAIAEDVKESSIQRLSQNVAGQEGSGRVPGKSNGPMKAVYGGRNKHNGYNSRLYSGNEDTGSYVSNGVNKRSVWKIATQPFPDAHFAVFPPKLIEPCVLAGCPEGGVVLDPFAGAGTSCHVAKEFKRNYIGIELNPEYIKLAEKRTAQGVL